MSLFNTTTPGFGATPAGFGTPTTNLSFSGANPNPTPNTGLTFGAPAATAPTGGLSFGAPSAGNTSFGIATPSTQGANLSFGTPATTNTGFSFGNTATNPPTFGLGNNATQQAPKLGLSFGSATTSAAPAPSFGLSSQTTATQPGFSFGSNAGATGATTSAPSLNFGTGGTAGFNLGTTTAPNLSFGLGSTATPASSALNFGFGSSGTTTVATTSAPVGLGGVATFSLSTSTPDASKTEQTGKEQCLPNELQQSVDNFKSFVKQQKGYSSDIARYSLKEFRKVESNINSVMSQLNEVEKQLQTNKITAEKLKYDTARGLQQVEIAQRTYDTPIGLQYENTAPLNFFIDLSEQFERDMQNLKLQIESTDKYVKSNGKSTPLTSQDLCVGMRRIHDTFVALAGRLQTVHSQVESQKEEYLNYRKSMMNDSTNVFENGRVIGSDPIEHILSFTVNQPPALASGPTPFGNISHPSVVQQAATQSNPPAYPQAASSTFGGFGTTMANQQQNTSLFGGSTTFGLGSTQFGANTSGFSLQKPPTGTKRGKQ